MRNKQKHSGQCCLCGKYSENLTFEHIPPHAALNDRSVRIKSSIDVMAKTDAKGEIQQKGAGSYCLCEKCNNDTGHWYGAAYTDFISQLYCEIKKNWHINDTYIEAHLKQIYPLRIVKQIMVMFCDINGYEFGNSELHDYLLHKDSKEFVPENYDCRLFMYWYNNTYGKLLPTGTLIIKQLEGVIPITRTVISSVPIGYDLYTTPLQSYKADGLDITGWFSRYAYSDCTDLSIKMPVPVDRGYI